MVSKSALGKTAKYSDIVNKVKGNQSQDEPNITKEQVIAAFRSFGFEPGERNHNDIGYWSTKKMSEGPKLMELLHKRRKEINDAEDAKKKDEETKNKAKETLPRLSDHEINAMYDEYGVPAPDPEWARNHLPNDPTKIRSILEMQRKTADDMLKKHTKNMVNSMPEVPKAQNSSTPVNSTYPMSSMAMSGGVGGPTPGPVGMMGGPSQTDSPGTPFFIGDNAIVRIPNPNNPYQATTWLVDKNKKTLQPFASDRAFKNAFENPEEAERAVVHISTKDLAPGGVLSGFQMLDGSQGVDHDGKRKNIEFSHGQIQKRYGKASNQQAEQKSLSMIDGILGKISKPQQ